MESKILNKGVYVATTEPNSGKSIVSLGLMDTLIKKGLRVGYFRPVIDDFPEGKIDNHINTITSYFHLDLKFEDSYAFTRNEIIRMKNENKDDEIFSRIIRKYKAVEKRFDFVIVEGSSFTGEGSIIEFDINILIAKNLAIPAIILASGVGRTMEDFLGTMLIAYDSFRDKSVKVVSIIANKVEARNQQWVVGELEKNLSDDLVVSAIPMDLALSNPSIKEIVEELDAKILFGSSYINNLAGYYSVGAMHLPNYLKHLKENGLVITPGDRADLILGALQANISANYPSISGIVLTGGLLPEDSIIRLIEGLSEIVPIISTQGGTFSVTNRIGMIKSQIYAENTEKIALSIDSFRKNTNVGRLTEMMFDVESKIVTPGMFQYELLEQAKSVKKHIVLPEGVDERILQAARLLIKSNAVDLTILGNRAQIEDKVRSAGVDLDLNAVHVIDPLHSDRFDRYADTLYELRKHKNVTREQARELLKEVSYFGTMMVYSGDADGMVSGAMHTTQNTIRPALQLIKTKPETSLISSVFFMLLEDRVSVYGDCAINTNPTAEQLAQIASSSADTSVAFGIEPKIAMLSYSSGASGVGKDVDKVREATTLLKEIRPDLDVEGPIQYDAAVDLNVGKIKMPGSAIAGRANVFIFPDLNTGNNTYKAVQRETKALAIGPIIQGLKKPVNDLSRGCTVEDIVNTVVVTAIQAQDV
ncbi:phosphate acetyltransferase [Membranicola marinus]|uniref:Phosphate acetyltransferase n=1 Tax=Membranihabitans marinus TaxID=1227546 RepID=A0A953HQH4_9BACT|nr:phosphate acetyltransferase [Membranihabitans marinus]MBY5959003.1 phosphate acetyltransferase [Membranihabitans marinus]